MIPMDSSINSSVKRQNGQYVLSFPCKQIDYQLRVRRVGREANHVNPVNLPGCPTISMSHKALHVRETWAVSKILIEWIRQTPLRHRVQIPHQRIQTCPIVNDETY